MGSRDNSNGSMDPTRSSVDKGVDFANYFCTYAYLYHQKEMLSDRVRRDAYFNAVFQNKHHFKDKAGARKVYAVEVTKMAPQARELARANDVGDVVEVIEGSIEDVTLPEKVDVIISEWMGYFLLWARDLWLKPNEVMYLCHARMWVLPISSGIGDQKKDDFESAMFDWYNNLGAQTDTHYGDFIVEQPSPRSNSWDFCHR